jgi:4-diphosphocytidyl-2-C-methyl-D-erythritol kinase
MTHRYFSPAKINLFFKVLGKREDGFHEIYSIMQTVSLFDEITITKSTSDKITTDHPTIPQDSTNLAFKAMVAFKNLTNIDTTFHIDLKKQIPIEAGLGGGSGNAATVLYALNEICGSPLKKEELYSLGATIGSDVPFFFSNGSALCSGRGEKVEEIPFKDVGPFTLVKPLFGLKTPNVYKNWINSVKISYSKEELWDRWQKNDPCFVNDLEEAAYMERKDLRDIKLTLLQCGFDQVVMSGSGTSFFCFGKGTIKPKIGLHIYQVNPITRSKNKWYYPESR